jgi:hypothetical protein
MSAQRCCVCEPTRLRTCRICGEAFAIVRKAGRPRDYCFVCEPPGWQVVRVAGVAVASVLVEAPPTAVARIFESPASTVWAAGARGEPVQDGWLRFKLDEATYRQLAGPDLSAIVTVDRQAGQILGVKFLSRQSG